MSVVYIMCLQYCVLLSKMWFCNKYLQFASFWGASPSLSTTHSKMSALTFLIPEEHAIGTQ